MMQKEHECGCVEEKTGDNWVWVKRITTCKEHYDDTNFKMNMEKLLAINDCSVCTKLKSYARMRSENADHAWCESHRQLLKDLLK
jgi:hypothetical protein